MATLIQVHWMAPKWRWTLKGHRRTNYRYDNYPRVPNLTPLLALRLAVFELQAILRQVHWMTPTWPSTLKGQKGPQFHVTTTPKSQISPLCPSTASRFWVIGHFETSALNDLKKSLNTKGSKVHITQLPPSPKFQSVSLYSWPFSSCRPFWDKCTE